MSDAFSKESSRTDWKFEESSSCETDSGRASNQNETSRRAVVDTRRLWYPEKNASVQLVERKMRTIPKTHLERDSARPPSPSLIGRDLDFMGD